MLLGGFVGEACDGWAMPGFIVGMAGWLYVLYLIFMGEASNINSSSGNEASQKSI